MPRISVIIPCYNQARYLPQAIESVLAQENADWDLFISDDASKDDSAEIIRRYAARDPRIRYHLHTANLGMAANWNWCLQQVHGQYIKYLFGDDYHTTPDALATLCAALDANPQAALVTSARAIVDENSKTTSTANHFNTEGGYPGRLALVNCLLANQNLIGEPSAVMFRPDLAVRGFDPTYRQLIDLEFWAHLLGQGNFAYIARPLCAFRRHSEQQTAVNSRSRASELEGLRIYAKYLPLLQQHIASGGSRHAVRRAVFRTIYFARKTPQRTPEALAAEQTLMAFLTPSGYAAHWLLHRISKPIANLQKFLWRCAEAWKG